jgi:alpha-glucuronidase
MANKWRVLHRPLNVGIDFSVELIKTCCILHNFVRSKDTKVICYKNVPSNGALLDNVNIGSQEVTRLSKTGVTERNKIADYFISNQGEVSWQNDKI